jgi:imidazolonepropionase-like amidohydrolase
MNLIRLRFMLLPAFAVVSLGWGADTVTLDYAVLMNGVSAGRASDVYGPNGRVDSTFEFNDRGRGPKITAHYVLSSGGLPARADITGVDYLKAPVDEHFAVEGGAANWKSNAENGHADGRGFYISIHGAPAESAFLVNALLEAEGKPVRLFPGGEARVERLADATLDSHGRKLHVTEYAVDGIAFEPQTVWLDDDRRFFGSPGKWFAILRSGWEDSNERLYALQLQARKERNGRMAAELSRHPKGPVAIEHVRLFDSEQAMMQPDQTVVVEGERITAAGPASSVRVPADAERIDGTGKTLLPGLFDMHAHLEDLDGPLNIASGVTSARDMGNDIGELKRLTDGWASGAAIGPRVWKAGLIDGPGEFQAPTGIYASTPEEARAAVNKYADLGYVQIKLYSSLKPDLVPGIAEETHRRGLRLSGHVPNGMTASQFVEAGADELQHINFVFLNFFAPLVKDTRTPERFTAAGDNAAKLDLESQPVNDFIALLLRHGTVVDVTLATFEGMFTGRPGKVSPGFAPVLDRLPVQMQRGAYTGGLAVTAANDQLYQDSYRAMLRMTKRMYDAGVPILAGTDTTAGIMLHRELELEVEAGIPPLKAMQIATWNAARLLKQDAELGSIAAGKRADLLLVEGNPGEHVSDIRRCRLVMKNGTLYRSDAVYAGVGIKPAT